ncbi:hypothetical protein E2542_SST28682 [Spatholobus suberectus]|nr:hypothetical protein E2542_SST28682 [Spatholobus suberectus]
MSPYHSPESLKNLKSHPKAVLSIADGGIWQKAKIPPYKHTIATYDAIIVGLLSQIAYGGWQKIHHGSHGAAI